MKSNDDQFKPKVDTNDLQRRQLLLVLVARTFELEKGRPPKTMAELVPGYLKVAPLDPFTGKEMNLPPLHWWERQHKDEPTK
jgi:hypothetical protein